MDFARLRSLLEEVGSGILFDACSDVLSCSLVAFYLTGSLRFNLAFYLTYTCAFCLAFFPIFLVVYILASCLSFYLTFILAFVFGARPRFVAPARDSVILGWHKRRRGLRSRRVPMILGLAVRRRG